MKLNVISIVMHNEITYQKRSLITFICLWVKILDNLTEQKHIS